MTSEDRANHLEIEAACYGWRADRIEQTQGPGTQVDLLRAMADSRMNSAQTLRDRAAADA